MWRAAQGPPGTVAGPCGAPAGHTAARRAIAAPRTHARRDLAVRAAVEVAEATAPASATAKDEGRRERQGEQHQQQRGGAAAPRQQRQNGARRGGQQGQQQQRQQRQGQPQGQPQGQQGPQRRRRQQPGRRPPSEAAETPVVRVADNSSLAGAAGSVCKAMRGGELVVRVVSVDDASLSKAAMVLTLANTMAKQDLGQMLSFQPTRITRRSASLPSVPEGATVFYAARVAAGDILTDNTLLATKESDPEALGRAIIARVSTAGHTVLECLGQAATAKALQAVVVARKGLLVRLQDVACVIASTYVSARQQGQQQQQQQEGTAQPQPAEGQQRRAAPADARKQQQAGGDAKAAAAAGGGAPGQGEASQKRVLANRIVVLECAPRDPSLLRVRSTYGKAG